MPERVFNLVAPVPPDVLKAAEAAHDYLDRVINDEFPEGPLMLKATLSQQLWNQIHEAVTDAVAYAQRGEP